MNTDPAKPRASLATGAHGSYPLVKQSKAWAELQAELQRRLQWASQFSAAAAAVLADLPRQVAQVVETARRAQEEMRRFLESPRFQQFLEEMRRPDWWEPAASAYCDPYQREVVELGLRALSKEEQLNFMMFGSLLAEPDERRLGRRPPMLQVAVVGRRPDIALALLLRQGLDRKALHSLEVADAGIREELAGQAALALGEQILPALEKQINRLGLRGLNQLKSLLAEVTRDAYLVVAIRRELVRYLRKEELHRKREEAQEPAVLEDELPCAPEQERLLSHWAIEQSITRFLNCPQAKRMDAQILDAIRDDPERSSASIARELGVPETTVRYRRRLLMRFLSRDREN